MLKDDQNFEGTIYNRKNYRVPYRFQFSDYLQFKRLQY